MTAVPLPKKRSKRQTLYNYSHVRVTGSDIEELLGIYVAPQKPKAIKGHNYVLGTEVFSQK
jgi:hypothetical protein